MVDLEQLSKFKVPTKPKVELWLLFAPSMLPRGLASVKPEAVEHFAARITAMYGTDEWRDAYEARRRNLLSASELRDELRLRCVDRWQDRGRLDR